MDLFSDRGLDNDHSSSLGLSVCTLIRTLLYYTGIGGLLPNTSYLLFAYGMDDPGGAGVKFNVADYVGDDLGTVFTPRTHWQQAHYAFRQGGH